jgi:uncharacterized protein (TIGR03437 family)
MRYLLAILLFAVRAHSAEPALGFASLFGPHGSDPIQAVATDSAGNVWVAGTTISEIPLVNPLNSKPGTGNCSVTPPRTFAQCEDVFVAKFDPTGKLLYSTYLGTDGRDYAAGIALDRDGNVYVAGTTKPAGFPIPRGGQAWVMKLNPSGSALLYDRTIAGDSAASAVAVDARGNAYLAGTAYTLDFPAVNGLQAQAPVHSIFATNDAGASWRPINNNLRALTVNSLAIDPTQTRTLYAATSAGLYKSLDAGASWTQIFPDAKVAMRVVIDPRTPATLFALYGDSQMAQVAKTTDGGATWQVLTANLPPPRYPAPARQFGDLAVDPQHPEVVWLTDVALGSPAIYRSTDGGAHWTSVRDFPPPFIFGQGDSLGGGQIQIDRQNTDRVYVCCSTQLTPSAPALFRTDDGGKTWVEGAHAPIGTPAVDPTNGATLYGTSGREVYRSTDAGQTWTTVPLPPYAEPGSSFIGFFRSPAFDPSGALYLTNDGGLLLRSTDGGATWTTRQGPWSYHAADVQGAWILGFDPSRPSTVYVSWPGIGGNPLVFEHAFAAKLDAAGTMAWSTLLAGSQQDEAHAIAVDSAGNPVIAGSTNSLDFPLAEPLQAERGRSTGYGFDAFLTKISSDGTKLLYSTYFGGTADDSATALTLDSADNMWLAGTSYHSSFVSKLDASGQKLLYSTDLPGTAGATTAVLDSQGALWVAGPAAVNGMPVVHPIQASSGGDYVARLVPQGESYALGLSTYLGGYWDTIAALAPTAGGAWLAGTSSSEDFLGSNGSPNYSAGFLARIDLDPPPPPPGVPTVRGVYNSAGFRLGDAVSPGEIVALIGAELAPAADQAGGFPLPRTLQGVSVLINGAPAPLLYVSPGQINVQVPYEVSYPNLTLVVRRGDQLGAERRLRILPVTPGIFTSGDTPVMVHSADYTLVTEQNPARPGEYLSLFCTGLGAVSPTSAAGEAATGPAKIVQPNIDVVTDGVLAGTVSYAGLAPGYAGLYQVNFPIRATDQPGRKLLTIGILGIYSNYVPLWVK